MKFTISTAKTVAKPAAKAFDFVKAEEALIQSFEAVSASYSALVAAEGRVTECEQVVADCRLATESIRQFGVTATTMGIFNGKDHTLDRALGLEELAIASLESMSAASKQVLQGKYLAGLEDNSQSAWATFKENVTKWFARFIEWLRNVFMSSAKLVKMVKEAAFENFDAEKVVNVLSKEDCLKAIETMEKALAIVRDTNKTAEQVIGEMQSFNAPDLQKKEDKASALGWTSAEEIKGVVAKFLAAGGENAAKAMDTAWKAVQTQYKAEMAQAGNDPALMDKVRNAVDGWKLKGKVTGDYNKMLRAAGLTLYTLSKATKAPETAAPAAEAPKA